MQDEDEDDDDDDDDYSAGEETALECYATPLDDDECPVDEYVIFKEVLMSKWTKNVCMVN